MTMTSIEHCVYVALWKVFIRRPVH